MRSRNSIKFEMHLSKSANIGYVFGLFQADIANKKYDFRPALDLAQKLVNG